MAETTKQVPLSALRFVADLEIGDNGDGAKTAPFKMMARSKDPVSHWYWGRVVHDMAGFTTSKPRLPVDYCHCEDEVLGFANKFDTSSGDLIASGALTPFEDKDRASEVLFKQKQGVPYEASIFFDPAHLVVEDVPEGFTVGVNGYQFAGPGLVIRQWKLRGIAICPYGQDGNTSVEFNQQGRDVAVKFTGNQAMPPEQTTATAEAAEVTTEAAVEAVTETDTATEAVAETAAAVEVATEETTEQATAPVVVEAATAMSEGQRFLTAFGDQGGVWFAQGKKFEDAQAMFTQNLRTENERLAAKVTELQTQLTAGRGEADPLSFSSGESDSETTSVKPTVKQEAAIGAGLAKFAANIKFKK